MTTLDEIRQMILKSDRESDWHDIVVGTYFREVPLVDDDTFEWHNEMIVYRPDVDLTIQWGMRSRRLDHVTTAEQLWDEHGRFPDPAAHVEHADVFWRGNLIDRVELVTVDGGRALLPVGDRRSLTPLADLRPGKKVAWEYSATRWEVGLARLLDNDADFDRYFSQTTMVVQG